MSTQSARELEVVDLGRADFREAVAVLARGMRDNPVHVAAFGPDSEHRRQVLERLFAALFETMDAQQPIGLREGARLVAVTGVAPPGRCQPTPRQALDMAPAILAAGPRAAARTARWVRAWAAHDPADTHVHLGPLAVDADLQGQGIGSRLLAEHCRRLDRSGEVGYLETDKRENVSFYARQGFETVGEAVVLATPCWFMRRPARPRSAETG